MTTLDQKEMLMAKIGKEGLAKPEEHPEDKANRLAAEAEAAKIIDGFFAKNQNQFKKLVQTYADAEAEELLADLREKFWTRTF